MSAARGLWRGRRGAAGVMIAFAMPLLIGIAAFAVDLGTIALEARRLQGTADAAALVAAGEDAGETAARTLLTRDWGERAVTLRVVRGDYVRDANVPLAQRFRPGAGDAVRVELQTPSPTFFARIWGEESVDVVRSAVALRKRTAAFSIGSRLVSVDNKLVAALLGGLGLKTGPLGVLDYRSLSGATIDVFQLLAELKLRGAVTADTYGAQLATQVPLADLFAAAAATLDKAGPTGVAAAGVVRQLGTAVPARSVALAALVDAGPLADRNAGGSARVPALPLLTALLTTGGTRQVALDLGTTVPGLASTRVWLAIGEPAARSPMVAVTNNREPVLHTAQARVFVRARLAPAALPGIGPLVSLELPLVAEIAGGEARLSRIDCPPATKAVTLEGRVDPATLSLGTTDESKLGDFTTALKIGVAKVLDVPLLDVTGYSRVSLGAAEPWQSVRFTEPAIAAATPTTIRGSRPVAGIAASLVSEMQLTPHLLGLPIPLAPLLKVVGTLLGGVAAPIDAVLTNLLGALGIGLGEADLAVTQLRCNAAVLVE